MLKRTLALFDSVRDKIYYIKQNNNGAALAPAYLPVKNNTSSIFGSR